MDTFNSPWPSPPRGLDALSNEALQMDMITDLQEHFEPQTRARSNTWPLPRPENFVEPTDDSGSTKCSNQQLATCGTGAPAQTSPSVGGSAQKKNSSRRNAWGNLSYADLITQAIGSASDNRLTLSQIYEWMVQNVPYFKDKGDSNSSAGWKNSIRHNLSLHNRFMRVQNEGTGKSSWWMLNPDAKPGKSVRRRAASMETSKYEKRRGRAKKRVEALRSAGLSVFDTGIAGINDVSPSPSSSVSEGLDLFPDSPLHSSGGFQLSPDFRQRASSNASSVGRLSPIPAVIGVEPDWSFTPPGVQLSADYAQQDIDTADGSAASVLGSAALDQLAGSLADDLTLQKEFLQGFSNASVMHSQPPPPYQPPQPYSLLASVAQSYGVQPHSQCAIHRRQQCTCMHNSRESMSPASGTGMSPSYPHSEPSPDPMGTYNSIHLQSRITSRPNADSPPNQSSVNCHNNNNNNNNTLKDHTHLPHIINNTSSGAVGGGASVNNPSNMSDMSSRYFPTSAVRQDTGTNLFNGTEFIDYADSNMPSTLMGQFMEALNNQTNLDDLALNIDSFHGGLECNVDEVIQQELNIDGLLDINIPISNHNHHAGSQLNSLTQSSNAQTSSSSQQQQHQIHQASMGSLSISQANQSNQYPQTSVTPPSWVHLSQTSS